MKGKFSTILFVSIILVSMAYVNINLYGVPGEPPPGWPSKLPGDGEFMIFLHSDLRYGLEKVEVTIQPVAGTTLYSGTTLLYDEGVYQLAYPFSCRNFLTLTPIYYVKDSDSITRIQLNGSSQDVIGHVGHSYDSLLAGTSRRPYMLGYGLYEISMKFYYTQTSYSLQRWYVDLKDPNYPYDTHGFSQYYDICFCVNPGNGNNYSASAYLSPPDWESWDVILPNNTGQLSDAFYGCRYHRNTELGLPASSFEHFPVTVVVSGPSVIYAYYNLTSAVKSSGNEVGDRDFISIPTAQSPKATATYTANPECGTQQYSYQWHLKKPGWTNWIYQGSGKSVTITQTSDFYIRCTVTSGTETAENTKFVDVVVVPPDFPDYR